MQGRLSNVINSAMQNGPFFTECRQDDALDAKVLSMVFVFIQVHDQKIVQDHLFRGSFAACNVMISRLQLLRSIIQ